MEASLLANYFFMKKIKKVNKKKLENKSGFGLQPLADRIVLEEVEEKMTSPSGIYIPESVKQDKGAKMAKVIAVGEGRTEDGKLIPVKVKKGDTVLFSWGDQITYQGKDYFIVRENEVIAIIQ
jgi:chaperonin GroES